MTPKNGKFNWLGQLCNDYAKYEYEGGTLGVTLDKITKIAGHEEYKYLPSSLAQAQRDAQDKNEFLLGHLPTDVFQLIGGFTLSAQHRDRVLKLADDIGSAQKAHDAGTATQPANKT